MTDRHTEGQAERQTLQYLPVLYCSAAFQASKQACSQASTQAGWQVCQAGRQAGSREVQKGWEEGRKEGRKAGGQECRRTGIQADRKMYRKTDVQIYILCHTANKIDLLVLLSELTRLESCCTGLLNLLRKDLGRSKPSIFPPDKYSIAHLWDTLLAPWLPSIE